MKNNSLNKPILLDSSPSYCIFSRQHPPAIAPVRFHPIHLPDTRNHPTVTISLSYSAEGGLPEVSSSPSRREDDERPMWITNVGERWGEGWIAETQMVEISGNNGEGTSGEGRGRFFRRRRWGKTQKVDSTWWSSGPVVVMVPSGGAASDGGGGGGGVEPRCNRCYERGGPLSLSLLCMCHLLGWSKSYMYRFFFFFFFRDTAFSPILVAPEIISGDYWGAALDEWRLGDEMYLSVFEGSGSGRRVAGVEFFSSRSMDREILYIFLFFISRIVFRVQNLITNFWVVDILNVFFFFLLEEWSFGCELDENLTHRKGKGNKELLVVESKLRKPFFSTGILKTDARGKLRIDYVEYFCKQIL